MCPRPTRRTRRSPPLKSRSTKRSAMLSASKWLGRPSLSPTSSKKPSAGQGAILTVLLLAETWSLDLYPFLPQWAPTILDSVAEAALTLLIGWYAWRFFETGLAVKLSHAEGGSQSRARTVQPLLRAVGRLVIGAIALMSALSSLGLNIAPLLASARVVGIAVGFGAQTLVRDLFSGASYLIKTYFVSATISKANAKGTVERITFRTIALCHQNGRAVRIAR
jgi:small-conductance mechanosensitive channel